MTIVELYLYGDEEVFKDNDNWYINTFRPLAEATGMDIEIFYKTFMDSKNQACLETPKRLWAP
jgi:hypothetical protein